MKRLLSLIIAATMLLALAACAPKTETKYILTEFSTTMVDGTVQRTVHHYSEDWILTGSTVYRNGEVDLEIAYELNDRGDVKTVTYSMDGETMQTEEYVTGYDDNGNIIRTDVYTNGEKTASSTVSRTFDESGVLVSSVQTSATLIIETAYNPDGTEAKQVIRHLDLGASSTTEYTYDSQGNEIRSATTNESGILMNETNSSYDGNGHILVSVNTSYNEDGTPRESYASESTWEGLVKTTHSFGIDGVESSYSVTEYDEAGNMIRHEIYSGEKLMTSQVMTYIAVEVPVS